MVFEVQTRDESGELRFFPTLKGAFAYARDNPSIWKVSFPVGPEENCERCRLVKKEDVWVFEDIMSDVLTNLGKRIINIPGVD